MIVEKQGKKLKVLLAFMLIASFILGQQIPVRAAEEKTDYAVTFNRSVHTLKKGQTVKLKATLNEAAEERGLVWRSSRPEVASVSKDGEITAIENGEATVTARIKGTKAKASCRIVVGTPVSKVRLREDSVSLEIGEKFTLKASVSPRGASIKEVTYVSSNRKVASVSKKGVIRAVSAGTARIRVTAADGSGKRAFCAVNVTENIKPVTGVKLDTSQLILKPGEEGKLSAIVEPSDATNQEIRWETSDQAVAQVADDGTVKAVAEGIATVTAMAGSNVQAICTVKVASASEHPEEAAAGKILVAYFSWSGTSERIARNIIEQTGADSFCIERETPYSDDYSEVAYGEAKEEADNNARPPIKDPLASMEQYDKIVLCYPIWWHTAPMTVGTFLERYDFSGKYIYPVSQSASMSVSQCEQSVAFIKDCAKGAVVDDGIFTKDLDLIRRYMEEKVTSASLQ